MTREQIQEIGRLLISHLSNGYKDTMFSGGINAEGGRGFFDIYIYLPDNQFCIDFSYSEISFPINSQSYQDLFVIRAEEYLQPGETIREYIEKNFVHRPVLYLND